MAHKVLVAAVSDLGCVRTNNEDFYGFDLAHQVYVVCDGMGGMAAGEVASQTAVNTFLDTVKTGDHTLPVEGILDQAIHAANTAVFQAGQLPEHKGMGTTLVAASVRDLALCIGNVGDSRAYVIHDHVATQVTIDHSYLNELIRAGIVDIKDAATVDVQGMQTVITRAIGVEGKVDPDFFSVQLSPDDVVLLASDGLTRYLEAPEIGLLVGACDLQTSAQNMINIAKERGGTDNITVLLLQVVPEQVAEAETTAQATPASSIAEPEPSPAPTAAESASTTAEPLSTLEALLAAEPTPAAAEPPSNFEDLLAAESTPAAEPEPATAPALTPDEEAISGS